MDKDLTPLETKALAVLEDRRFWTLIVVAAVIVMGIFISRFFMDENRKAAEQKAAEKLFLAEHVETEGVSSNNGSFSIDYVKRRAALTPENKQEIRTNLQALLKEFPTTQTAQTARVYLASLDLQDGKLPEALQQYDEVIAKGSSKQSDIPTLTAKVGKGYVLESMQKFSDAYVVYEDLAKDPQGPLLGEALLGKARALQAQSKDKEALPVLKTIENDFAGTTFEEMARAMETTLKL